MIFLILTQRIYWLYQLFFDIAIIYNLTRYAKLYKYYFSYVWCKLLEYKYGIVDTYLYSVSNENILAAVLVFVWRSTLGLFIVIESFFLQKFLDRLFNVGCRFYCIVGEKLGHGFQQPSVACANRYILVYSAYIENRCIINMY